MRLSSMADYAVVTMSAAARHCGDGGRVTGDGRAQARFSAGQLADETGLPAPTVQKVVSRLTAAGLLRSSRGATGGGGRRRHAQRRGRHQGGEGERHHLFHRLSPSISCVCPVRAVGR